MVEVLLVVKIFFTEDSKVENLLCDAPSCSEACLLFSDDLLRLWLVTFFSVCKYFSQYNLLKVDWCVYG